MTVAELITHLARIRDQDAQITIRIQRHQFGQSDLDPVGCIQCLDVVSIANFAIPDYPPHG